MASRIAPFSSQHLEAACRVLADTAQGLTGTQIGRLLQEIQVVDPSPDMTKWKRLFNALAGAQNRHQVGNHLIMFINRAMNPVSYANDPGTFAWRRDELNVGLAFSGFYVREDGKVGYADKANTLDEARAQARRLKEALESRAVHAEVLNYCCAARRCCAGVRSTMPRCSPPSGRRFRCCWPARHSGRRKVTQLYTPDALQGKLVVAVVNFPPKQIGPIMSKCLVTGFHNEQGDVALCVPDQSVPPGTRLL